MMTGEIDAYLLYKEHEALSQNVADTKSQEGGWILLGESGYAD